ncbi:hypothetical protein jhhlp_003954 [Lomentospora prolificans]|uniref:laccase n=1 Tax=Lomentospora prolificans TaxID=41688 RepID=A0A2N3NA73_9PEZI|nr:hypothetical protein jhhlp_003954 [Lomentospora prolificans]
MRSFALFQAVGLFLGLGNAAPSPIDVAVAPRELVKRAPTCNTPSNRACWSDGFNINTDYEASIPDTGVTRHYDFTVSQFENWIGGDGIEKKVAMLINGQFPGPTVRADWGDWVEIKVTNNLTCDGTSIHWHGIRMRGNSVNDGANGVTECPIAPGTSKTYRFRAEQYGTGWYHSHYSAQYANGLLGTVVIDGPASLPYDEDLGVFPINDWYYGDAEEIGRGLIPPPGAAPAADNVLFNGTHVNAQGGGEYARVVLKAGKRHRLRLINPSVDISYSVTLANHDLTVISTDFVPVNAFTTPSVFLNPGQRVDVTIDASKTAANYWFNVTFSTGPCGASRIAKPAAIFQYDTATPGTPTSPGNSPADPLCHDNVSYTPVISRTVPSGGFTPNDNNTIEVELLQKPWEDVPNRVYWNVHGHDMNITWENPTLEYVANGDLDFPERYNVHTVDKSNGDWAFWLIENTSVLPHPMHLHGHDFYVLGRSDPPANPFNAPMTNFNPSTDMGRLRFSNPTRRDTTTMPARGWLLLAFRVDNPGAWLFHCHIAWHAGQGLSMQFLESVADIPPTVDLSILEPVCSIWSDYYSTSQCKQWDSGL